MVSRRSAKTSLSLVYASTSIVWTSYAMLAVALPFRFQALGLSVVQYGVAIAGLAFGMLLTESVWGVLAFRLAKVRMILVLGLAVTLVYLGIGELTSFLGLAVLLGLLGALLIFQVPLIRWMALTALGPGTGATGTGIYGLFSGAGLVLGTALGPLLFVQFGFTTLALLSAVIYVVGVVLTVILPWSEVALPPQQSGFARHVREVFTRPFALAASLVFLAFIAKSLILNFLQYYSRRPLPRNSLGSRVCHRGGPRDEPPRGSRAGGPDRPLGGPAGRSRLGSYSCSWEPLGPCSRPRSRRWSGRRSSWRPGWDGLRRPCYRWLSTPCRSGCREPRWGCSGPSRTSGSWSVPS